MADNVTTQSAAPATPAASTIIATVEATHSGDTVQAGVSVLAKSAGAEGSRVLTVINPATEDKQDTAITALGALATQTTAAAILAKLITAPATAAKQPALGVAGTPSADVITVQGASGGTVLPVGDGGGSLTVDGSVSISGLVPGVSATSLGKAEDAVAADGDTGVMTLAVRKDVAATTVGADGDYHPLEVDGSGRLWVNPSGVTQPISAASLPLPAGASTSALQTTGNTSLSSIDGKLPALSGGAVPVTGPLTDTQIRATALPVSLASVPSHAVTNAGTFATQAVSAGDVAHDGADSGNPVKVGARARSSEIAAVSNNDRSDLITDLVGKLITLPYANPENFVSGAIISAMTGTTSTSLVAAPGAGLRNYITTLIISNAHATVGTDVVIQDGSGGTTLLTIPAAAVYGGAVINLPVPLRQPTTNTALFCANVTTGASVKASAVGFKGV